MYIQLINRIALFITACTLFSCLDTNLDSDIVTSQSDLIYGQSKDVQPGDEFKIIAIVPRSKSWDAIVEYSGGCGEHVFNLALTQVENLALKTQTEIALWHNGFGDNCESLVRDTISFNIEQVIPALDFADVTIVKIKNAYNKNIVTVDLNLAKLTSNNCTLKGEIAVGYCVADVWLGQWVLVKDSVKNHRQVWLQPVRVAESAQLNIPKVGKANFAVSVLFGYDYLGDVDANAICEKYPQGTTIPVIIECYEPK